uniref:Uncharacterized protein n=1 Tax=Meloidogyne hapla TaxID=6305 RepID=A0A1I8BUG1_MELHA
MINYPHSSPNSTTERRAHFNNINELYEDEQKEKEYFRGESINCKLQLLNILHAIFGAIGLGLAGTQFQTKIGIDNYRQIDLRMASCLLYTITGTIGFYCVNRSHGSIIIKCLYCLTALFALGTAIFYGFTTYKLIHLNKQLNGRFEQFTSIIQFTTSANTNFVPKILISISMSILSFIVFLLAIISLALLDRLVAIENVWYPAWPDDRIKAKFNQILLFGASFGKLVGKEKYKND